MVNEDNLLPFLLFNVAAMTKRRVLRIQMFSEVVYTHKVIILILLSVLLLACIALD